MKQSIPFFLFVLLVLNSCCRSNDCEDNVNQAPRDLGYFGLDSIKPYFCFKAGSWWLYECDSTAETDSIVMTSLNVSVVHAEGVVRKYDYESFSYTQHSYTNNYDYKYVNYGSSPDSEDWEFFLMWEKARSKPGDYDGVTTMYSTKLEVGKTLWGGCTYRGKLKSLEVLGKTY